MAGSGVDGGAAGTTTAVVVGLVVMGGRVPTTDARDVGTTSLVVGAGTGESSLLVKLHAARTRGPATTTPTMTARATMANLRGKPPTADTNVREAAHWPRALVRSGRRHRPLGGAGGGASVGRAARRAAARRRRRACTSRPSWPRSWPSPPPVASWPALIEVDPAALDVLTDLGTRPPVDGADPATLAHWKQLEYLRIAARDLLGLDNLTVTVEAITTLATDVVDQAVVLTTPPSGERLAVVGMGKLGGRELNYASDIDVMFVGEGDPAVLERWARRSMEVARRCFRVDANLRPQGRDGPLVRTVASYEAYWSRWAEPWEFQALVKARAVAGDPELGAQFDASARHHLWERVFTADDLRSLRHMKARVEAELARKGLTDREVKRGRGGLRDIEFAVQLLQLVHGRLDPDLHSPTTLTALAELAASGYVDGDDAGRLADAYRFLRRVEHVLQLHDGAQVYAMPVDERDRAPASPAPSATGTRPPARPWPSSTGTSCTTRAPSAPSTSASTSARCSRPSPGPTPTSWPSRARWRPG